MTDTRNFGAACAPLIAAGLDPKWLLPAAPLDATLASRSKVKAGNLPKVQGLYNPSSGAWSGRHSAYDGGQPALSWGRAPEKIEAEGEWPTDSIHVVGHEAVLFDVDVADAEGAELAMQALAEILGADRVRAAPRRVRPNAPHRTSLVFAPAEPGSVPPSYTDFLRPGAREDDDGERLEWRGARTYWVCGGSMHPSGVRFEFQDSRGRSWAPGDGPLDWKRTDLPTVTMEETWAVLERMRELVEARGWTNVAGRRERTRAAGGGAGRVVPSEIDPMVPIELLEEAIAAIPNSSEYEDALAELASLRFMYGNQGKPIPEVVADWVQRRLTDSSDWLAEDKWGSFDAGVAPSPGAFMKIVQVRADPELADRL
ncbi:MAG: bifunctional DNA primase/polymerase, partial [Burkholderiales bacterium]|nr:bifunctional DNA primase/polymerase [Burkholderiales bacterium]